MWYIICYLIVGVVLTMLYQPEPDETMKDLIVDAVIGILAWPYSLVATAMDMLRGED